MMINAKDELLTHIRIQTKLLGSALVIKSAVIISDFSNYKLTVLKPDHSLEEYNTFLDTLNTFEYNYIHNGRQVINGLIWYTSGSFSKRTYYGQRLCHTSREEIWEYVKVPVFDEALERFKCDVNYWHNR
jgi:hypothetical protein